MIATPLAGVAEFTVSTQVTGATGAVGTEVVPPPPQALMERARQVAIETAEPGAAIICQAIMGVRSVRGNGSCPLDPVLGRMER